jgi:hypothetical protein
LSQSKLHRTASKAGLSGLALGDGWKDKDVTPTAREDRL